MIAIKQPLLDINDLISMKIGEKVLSMLFLRFSKKLKKWELILKIFIIGRILILYTKSWTLPFLFL